MHLLENEQEFSRTVYFEPSALEKLIGICPIRFGRNIAKPNYRLGPRRIDSYSLHFVLEGRGEFQQNNTCYKLKAGDVFCLFPKVLHSYRTHPDHLLRLVWIGMAGKQVLPLLNRIGIRPHSPHVSGMITSRVVQMLDGLFEQSRHPASDHGDLVNVSTVLRLFQAMTPVDPAVATDESEDWIRKGREYMDMHFTEGITVRQAAEFAGVDRTHFSKKFSEVYGICPLKYLQSLIMKEAIRMTRETSINLSDIAVSVGFPDLYTFSRAFKRYYGVSPNKWRKKELSGGS